MEAGVSEGSVPQIWDVLFLADVRWKAQFWLEGSVTSMGGGV